MNNKKLLQLRKEISARRPEFVLQDHHKRPETPKKWKKPKGMHSKMRHGVWGRPASVNPGYRGPAAVRGLAQNGMQPVLVHNIKELEEIKPDTQAAIIAHVGDRNKTTILQACKQKNIIVLNVKNIDEKIKKIQDALASRKESKKTARQRKTAKAQPEKKKEEKTATKEEERKEMEKVLTKRE